MPIITITWVSQGDAKTCNVCKYLHGKTWTIIADELPHVISHPHYGDVYDLKADESLAHGYGPWHCRCKIIIEIEDDMRGTLTDVFSTTENLSDNLGLTIRETVRVLNFLRGFG